MKQFHELKVSRVDRECRDALRVTLDVPIELQQQFVFSPGQHLPLSLMHEGRTIRRTYSICSASGSWPLEIGVRTQPGGEFSEYVANELKAGDRLDVMPPSGRFHVDVDTAQARSYLGFAAGSGITPILSIMRAVLESGSHNRFALFYGNRELATTMFIEDLFALKNRFLDRLQLYFLFSREAQEFAIMQGRLDSRKVGELYRHFCSGLNAADAYVCGPETMIADVTAALRECGLADEHIHSERFGVPRTRIGRPQEVELSTEETSANVTVIMDGHRKSFSMPLLGKSIVDAAAENGIDLPFSCKAGVCATCRTHLNTGDVSMDANYGLEPWEVEQGFILACQSHPVCDNIVLDYDKT